ncbi:coronin like WD40 repeat protein [Cryptosporidium felis]|nr:coronin like WD40 repeat protein [Cryptosporidium felis]
MQAGISGFKTLSSKILKENYSDLKIGTRLNESTGLTCSSKFIAYANDGGGGSASVISMDSIGVRKPPIMVISGHSAGITDLKFSPFYNNYLATSSDDKSIKTWKLPNSGEFFDVLESDIKDAHNTRRGDFVEKISSPITSLHGHEKRVTLMEFNRNANNILSSTSSDGEIAIWDLERSLKIFSYRENKNLCYDIKWNFFGSLLSTTNKDRLIRIVDPREQTTVLNFLAHEGTRIGKCTWMGGFGTMQNKLVTTGFTKAGSRSVKLWDIRNTESSIIDVQLDNMSSTLYPHFIDDFKLLTIFGKGDGNFRVFKFENSGNNLTQIEEVRTTKPQRGVCFLPTRCLDIGKSEVIRLYKAVNTDSIDVVSLCLPRKQHTYSEELFPDCYAGIPSCSSDDWRKGITNPPVLVSMDPKSNGKPYIPNEDDFLSRQLSKSDKSLNLSRSSTSALLKKKSSILSSKNSFNYFNELPKISEDSEIQEKEEPSLLKKSSKSGSNLFSKLTSLLSFGKRSNSSLVKITSRKTTDVESFGPKLHVEDHIFDSFPNSEKVSVHGSTASSYYGLNPEIISVNMKEEPSAINKLLYPVSCKNVILKSGDCNLFQKRELEYNDILDYKTEYSSNVSLSVDLPTCHFNIKAPEISMDNCNFIPYKKESSGNNNINGTSEIEKGFVKKMIESINSTNCGLSTCRTDSGFDRAKLICTKSAYQKSLSNASLDTYSVTSKSSLSSSTADFDSISSSIINSIRKDLEDANKRISQLDKALKSQKQKAIRPSQNSEESEKKSIAELAQLKEELSRISSEYYDLNTAYRQQSALFGLYKEFYGEIEDILAESIKGMRKVAAEKA